MVSWKFLNLKIFPLIMTTMTTTITKILKKNRFLFQSKGPTPEMLSEKALFSVIKVTVKQFLWTRTLEWKERKVSLKKKIQIELQKKVRQFKKAIQEFWIFKITKKKISSILTQKILNQWGIKSVGSPTRKTLREKSCAVRT